MSCAMSAGRWESALTTKPELHCLVARPLKSGGIGRSRRVKLSTAFLAMRAGWHVVGPDPQDEADLAKWEREQQPCNPFNVPRVQP